jgi:hypothetical protein
MLQSKIFQRFARWSARIDIPALNLVERCFPLLDSISVQIHVHPGSPARTSPLAADRCRPFSRDRSHPVSIELICFVVRFTLRILPVNPGVLMFLSMPWMTCLAYSRFVNCSQSHSTKAFSRHNRGGYRSLQNRDCEGARASRYEKNLLAALTGF